MSLIKSSAASARSSRALLARLIEMPDLARTIQQLPAQSFSAMVRKVGVEDAGELVALATTEQLVQAFDEDLFVNPRAGEREELDPGRFAAWLEVLLEAGEQAAARRVAQLDEDFVAHALSRLLLVLDEDALRERLSQCAIEDGWLLDKALESALSEELDGYILVAIQHEGWDAVLTLILALDRDHHALLERLLDRLAAVASGYLDDFDELATVLNEGQSLAEDVEAAREERRSRQGHVEPRAARAFLKLARRAPSVGEPPVEERDPLTRAYFRELAREPETASWAQASGASQVATAAVAQLEGAMAEAGLVPAPVVIDGAGGEQEATRPLVEALLHLRGDAPQLFAQRMEELVYLANVLVAGAEVDGGRMRLKDAADAVLATVCFGAALQLRVARRTGPWTLPGASSSPQWPKERLVALLRTHSADSLFRRASSALVAGEAPRVPRARDHGLLLSAAELELALG